MAFSGEANHHEGVSGRSHQIAWRGVIVAAILLLFGVVLTLGLVLIIAVMLVIILGLIAKLALLKEGDARRLR